MIKVENLIFRVRNRTILENINFSIPEGSFLAILGENGAGKTTLLDLLMGLGIPYYGSIEVMGNNPCHDNFQNRKCIVYLTDRIDLPCDWTPKEFFDFNCFFYPDYNREIEDKLSEELNIDKDVRMGNLSPGEMSRVQIIASLSCMPSVIIVDEINAVLDILGRRKLMQSLSQLRMEKRSTIIFATNILEDMVNHATDLLLLSKGKMITFQSLQDFLGNCERSDFPRLVAESLEDE